MRFALLVILVLLPPAAIAAQAPTIAAGTRVRVETDEKTQVVGTLMSQSSDSIIVAARGAIRTAVASEAVTRIAVSSGRSRAHGALGGMTLGAAVGGGAVALLFTAYAGGVPGFQIIPYVIVGAAIGGTLRGAVGSIRGVERWSTVYSAPIRVSFRSFPGSGPGIGVSIRF